MKAKYRIGIALLLLAGCHKAPPAPPAVSPPAPGTAVLQLEVVAEPKEGVSKGDTADYVTTAMQTVDYASLDSIVIWLVPPDARSDKSSIPPATIDVDPKKNSDDLSAAVTVGQQVILHNSGSTPSKFYSVSDGNEFDLGEISAGGTARATITSAGLIEVLSSINQYPAARLYAVPSRLFRMAKAGQFIEFRDLPPGKYKVVSWHPRLPGHEIDIDLPPDQVTNASVKVSVNGLPQVISRQ